MNHEAKFTLAKGREGLDCERHAAPTLRNAKFEAQTDHAERGSGERGMGEEWKAPQPLQNKQTRAGDSRDASQPSIKPQAIQYKGKHFSTRPVIQSRSQCQTALATIHDP